MKTAQEESVYVVHSKRPALTQVIRWLAVWEPANPQCAGKLCDPLATSTGKWDGKRLSYPVPDSFFPIHHSNGLLRSDRVLFCSWHHDFRLSDSLFPTGNFHCLSPLPLCYDSFYCKFYQSIQHSTLHPPIRI